MARAGVAALLLAAACAGARPAPGPAPASAAVAGAAASPARGGARPPAGDAPEGARAHGLEVTSLRLAAAGQVLDLRYRVLEAARAARVLSRGVKPVLVDRATGETFVVPVAGKVGALRQAPRALVEGRTYFVLFRNPDGKVERGRRLTLVAGDLSQDVVVE